ncbi:MAG: hypothetical protein ACRD3N_09000 [Terracidiphilus sp.]
MAEEVRKRLESAKFLSLEAMMEGYAAGAVELAARQFKQKLDFTAESIDVLDEVLVMVGEGPEFDLDFEVRLWGSYLGEVVRRRYTGNWEMTQYPGVPGSSDRSAPGSAPGPTAVPAVEVRGSRLFPLMKVHRRLTQGGEEDLRAFFTMVTERLGKPARVN